MLIDKCGIGALIPHAGAMCLLDGVLSWDATHIRCATVSHVALDNPLRRDERLGALCGVEYAVQAMAVHGALTVGGLDPPRAGYLASVRAVSVHADRLDLLPGTLTVEAERLHGDADRAIYGFTLRHADRILLGGRVAVALMARTDAERRGFQDSIDLRKGRT
jgi:predicted hotdog family 3-hydroxylacyl-ACP dehydratase